MPSMAQEWYTVYISRGGMADAVTVKAWDARDARCIVEDMRPGWRVVEVSQEDD